MFLLNGDGVEDDCPEKSNFAINAFSGELFLVRPLDRDPPNGRPVFELNITAEDDFGRKLDGMARVRIRVRDVNDNRPNFDRNNYSAKVEENNEAGVELIRVSAVDSDQSDVVRYAIEMNKVDGRGQLMFEVNELSGQLFVAVCCLDREDIDIYAIKVCASDGKHKTCCHVTIAVTDQNDNRPQFTRKTVIVSMASNELRAGRVVTNVSVVDLDLLSTNHFKFSLVPNEVMNYFHLVTTSDITAAFLVISRDIQTFSDISISVSVTDSDDSRLDFCYITIKVTNYTQIESNTNFSDSEGITTSTTSPVINITDSVPQTRDVIDKRISILVFVLGLALSLVIVVLVRRRPQTEEVINDFCSLRNYDSEGGETQNWTFDLSQLRVPETTLLPDVCHKKY